MPDQPNTFWDELQADFGPNGQLPGGGVSAVLSEQGFWAATGVYASGSVVTQAGSRWYTPAGTPARSVFNTAEWILLGTAPDTF